MEKGVDYKGRQYEEIEIGNVRNNLIGKTFGKLTVLFRVKDDKSVYYLTKCSCGNLVRVRGTHLSSYIITSCIDCREHRPFKDITGKTFGSLIVKGWEGDYDGKRFFWKCLCLNCGKETLVASDNLISGNTQSCGCMKYKINSLNGKVFGDWTVLSEPIHIGKKIYYQCECKCGTIRKVRADRLTSGIEDLNCGCVRESKGSRSIEKFLKERSFLYQKEICFPDLKSPKGGALRFDFAVFNEKKEIICLIEYDGEQHYKVSFGETEEDFLYQKHCDEIKNKYCKDKGLKLLRLSFQEQDNIIKLLEEYLA